MKKYEKNELAKEILKGLAVGGFVVACFAFPVLRKLLLFSLPKMNATSIVLIVQSIAFIIGN